MLSQDFPSIARRSALRLAENLQQPKLLEILESELSKLETGELESVFEAGRIEKLGLMVTTVTFLLQAISTGIDWQGRSNPPTSCEQVVHIIRQNITIDNSIPPEQQILIINIAAEEIVNQINPITQSVP
jgi:hypothetical protein